MHQYDIAPEYPEKHYYVKYKIVHGEKPAEIIEFWTDDHEEYQDKLQFIRLHHNYDFIKHRYPRRRGWQTLPRVLVLQVRLAETKFLAGA